MIYRGSHIRQRPVLRSGFFELCRAPIPGGLGHYWPQHLHDVRRVQPSAVQGTTAGSEPAQHSEASLVHHRNVTQRNMDSLP